MFLPVAIRATAALWQPSPITGQGSAGEGFRPRPPARSKVTHTMPKTDPQTNTRRSLLASIPVAAFGAAIAAPAVAAVAQSSSDAELIDLAAEFARLQALVEPVAKEFFATPSGDPRLTFLAAQEVGLVSQQDYLADQMRDIPARTQAGWIAKATVARALFLRHHKEEIEGDYMDEETAFAWSLISDLVAAGGQA